MSRHKLGEDTEAALDVLKSRAVDVSPHELEGVWTQVRRAQRARGRRRVVVGLGLAVAAAAAALLWFRSPVRPPASPEARIAGRAWTGRDHVVVAYAQDEFSLHDRVVTLSGDAELDATHEDAWRLLKGELRVDLSHPESRPLQVSTAQVRTWAGGGIMRLAAEPHGTSIAAVGRAIDIEVVAPGCTAPAQVLPGRTFRVTCTSSLSGTKDPASSTTVEPRGEPPVPRKARARPRPKRPHRAPDLKSSPPRPSNLGLMVEADGHRRAGRWGQALRGYRKVATSSQAGALLEEALLRSAEIHVQLGRSDAAHRAMARAQHELTELFLAPEWAALKERLASPLADRTVTATGTNK